MFGAQKGAHAFNIFKWASYRKSTLTTGLLDGVPCEVELLDYNKSTSPQSESPSEFLDDEALKAKPIINDLDLFFERVYSYYCEKGLWCIVVKRIVELLFLVFTICFSGFFFLYVDWNGLLNTKCGMEAVESGIRFCDLYKEALRAHPLTPFTLFKAIIVGYLAIFTIYGIFCFFRFFAQLKETLKIRQFYFNSLQVTDNELQTMPWALVLEKVVQVQSFQKLCVVKDLSIHDVLMRLMRKENYLIGLVNKGVLAFPIFGWLPGAGPATRVGPNGVPCCLVLPKTLEWTLNWCILHSMFDRNYHVRRDFVSDPETLKKRLMIVGIVLFLLSPFLVIFMLVYLFLRHAEQFYNHPSTASSRKWSNLSRWMFREFNEVEHLSKHRMNSSIEHVSNYFKQFPSPILTIVTKFISFVSGGFAAVLIITAFLEESLLEGHIFGHNLLWYTAVFGTITAISRAAITDELLVFDPQGAMSLVVQHTHHMPKRWRGKESTEAVKMEFKTLFQYTGMMLLEEMASIFITPFLLLFVVPKVDSILQFIVDFTVDVEGIGHVCSFSLFDFKNHGNKRYGSPFDSHRNRRSSQGKMEKSFLSFQMAYPSWEPGAEGKQFLSSLQAFTDQKLQGNRNNKTSPGSYRQFCTPWPMDAGCKISPYILDCHYTSNHHSNNKASFQSRHYANDQEKPNDSWVTSHESNCYNKWAHRIRSRRQGRLEAYTSAQVFQEIPEPPDLCAGLRTQGHILRTSFIEPPNFHGANADMNGGKLEEVCRSNSNSRGLRLSQTFYIDGLDSGGVGLPFDDIYRPSSDTELESLV